MEKYLSNKKTITKLEDEKGTLLDDLDFILKEIKEFYKK